MISPAWHHVLSGERRGLGPALMRGLLSLAAPFYGTAVAARNLAFDRGWRRIHQADVPVVSVGNLTTGGTGKTPVVAWLIEQLQLTGATPGILSRGYGGRDGAPNDEQLVLERLCPGTPHVQNPDRAAGARTAIAEHRCDVLVLDDGFQHRRLARQLDIVLIDVLQPWGYGALLPRGLLREPLTSLRRAGVACLTRVDQCDAATRSKIVAEIRRFTNAPIAEIAFVPIGLVNAAGTTAPLERLQEGTLGALCGIGNPQSFRRTLTSLGAPVPDQRFRAYPDHHAYTSADQEAIAAWIAATGIDRLVVTLKDLVKLPVTHLGKAPLWALQIGVEFHSGEPALRNTLKNLTTDQ